MKNLIAVVLLFCLGESIFAQTTEEQRKAFINERRAYAELASNALGKKVSKIANKEAKRLKKERWEPAIGDFPINIQLREHYTKQYEYDGTLPRYIIGRGQATGGSYAAARKQALALATIDVAATIQTEVTELTDLSLSNSSLSKEDAQSIDKIVSASQLIVQQSIGSLKPSVEMYREVGGKIEISILVLYDGEKARATILKEIEKESKELREKLEKRINEMKMSSED